jgi:hypothetical protein
MKLSKTAKIKQLQGKIRLLEKWMLWCSRKLRIKLCFELIKTEKELEDLLAAPAPSAPILAHQVFEDALVFCTDNAITP